MTDTSSSDEEDRSHVDGSPLLTRGWSSLRSAVSMGTKVVRKSFSYAVNTLSKHSRQHSAEGMSANGEAEDPLGNSVGSRQGGGRRSSKALDPQQKFRNKVNSHLSDQSAEYMEERKLYVSVCTWNVARHPPPDHSEIGDWICGDPHIIRTSSAFTQSPNALTPKLVPMSAASSSIPNSPEKSRRKGGEEEKGGTNENPSLPTVGSKTDTSGLRQQKPHGGSSPSPQKHSQHIHNAATFGCALEGLPDVVVVGLQEVELGGAALVLERTEASIAWMEAITDELNQRAAPYRLRYKKVEVVQLVGIVLILIGRSDHLPAIRHVRAAVTRTGAISGVLGNKGAIGLRASIYGKRFLFLCAHFCAHSGNSLKRCSNYHDSLAQLRFVLPPEADDAMDIAASSIDRGRRAKTHGSSIRDRFFTRKLKSYRAIESERALLRKHDYIFYFGDLNFRLRDIPREQVLEKIAYHKIGELLKYDELHHFMRAGMAFDEFMESPISFHPTYKVDPGTTNYDTSKKKRTPAWTDRVLYRVLDESTLGPSAPTTPVSDVGGRRSSTGGLSGNGSLNKGPYGAARSAPISPLTSTGPTFSFTQTPPPSHLCTVRRSSLPSDDGPPRLGTTQTFPSSTTENSTGKPMGKINIQSSNDNTPTKQKRKDDDFTAVDMPPKPPQFFPTTADKGTGSGAALWGQPQSQPQQRMDDFPGASPSTQDLDSASEIPTASVSVQPSPRRANTKIENNTVATLSNNSEGKKTVAQVVDQTTCGEEDLGSVFENNEKELPSVAERRLQYVTNAVEDLGYSSYPSLAYSDHLPVSAQFLVGVVRSDPDKVKKIIDDVAAAEDFEDWDDDSEGDVGL